jgi:hypothetical protein
VANRAAVAVVAPALLFIVPAVATLGCGLSHPAPAAPASRLTKPISFAILEDYDKGHDLRAVARDFALFQQLGAPSWRGSFGWDDYEPRPGEFDLDWLERFVSLADSMGISLHPYLAYTPAWAARGGRDRQEWNDPPRRLSEWARFVDTLARRLGSHPSLRSYEIYNEENAPLWWEGTSGEYARVVERASRAIRRSDPDARILLGGLVWPDGDWIEPTCDLGPGAFDVLPIHAYPETWTPESVKVENYLGPGYRGDFLPAVEQSCGPKPIWINEAGFATTPDKTERQQAEWWARAFPTFLAQPAVEHIGIYEIRDQMPGTPVIGDAPNYYLGLIRSDGTPKLAFHTVRLLLRLFAGDSITVADRELRVRVTEGVARGLHHHLFVRADGRRLVFVWERSGRLTVELGLAEPAGRVTSYRLDGSAVRLAARGSVIPAVELAPGEVRILELE